MLCRSLLCAALAAPAQALRPSFGAPQARLRAPRARLSAQAGADAGPLATPAVARDDWDERETWALEDSVPKYSLDGGRIVLWRRMSIAVCR